MSTVVDSSALPLSFSDFTKDCDLSLDSISRGIYRHHGISEKIKKEELAVKNLQKILRSAMHLSSRKGFHAMTLRDLSRETKISMGGLYAYFESKEELLHWLFLEGQTQIHQTLEEKINSGKSAQEKIALGICTHLYMSEILQKLFYFLYMEAKNLGKAEQKKILSLEQFTESIFEECIAGGMESGEFAQADPTLLASVLKAMLQDWYLKRYKFSRRKITVEKYAEFLIQFFLNRISSEPNLKESPFI